MERKSSHTGKKNQLIRVVVIGPESTGKSSLCTQLAEHYQTSWCPEYAREFLLEHGMNYSYEDLLTIAKGQISKEDEYAAKLKDLWEHSASNKRLPLLFIDTDLYVMKVWCEFVFGKCHPWILDQIVLRSCDLYLLCNVDLPWQKDELREYPDLKSRELLYHMYRDIMINQQTPWVIVSGDFEERLQIAIAAVDHLLEVYQEIE